MEANLCVRNFSRAQKNHREIVSGENSGGGRKRCEKREGVRGRRRKEVERLMQGYISSREKFQLHAKKRAAISAEVCELHAGGCDSIYIHRRRKDISPPRSIFSAQKKIYYGENGSK